MTADEATSEAREAAMKEVTTDKLEDVNSLPSPETEAQDAPEYRADVRPGRWTAPPSAWKVGDSIFLRLRDGKTAGPFYVVYCHPPLDRADKWRYDIKDASGKIKAKVAGAIMF